MNNGIAIIGIGCRYPDADSPKEFWENILAQRRAFRRMPDDRLPLRDYYSPDRSEADKTYSPFAALIDGFDFDRVIYRIAGTTFRATDIAQWLALQVATEALADAGYPDGTNLPKDTTGVLLGNTLAGEVSRANTLRLRWPYVKRTLGEALHKLGIQDAHRETILREAELRFKSSFPVINHENLAGGLSNTIPGRICNHFDFHGGGYTVDGACAASLLAVTTACSMLESRDLDLALAGGVDISLDPFELVGFAKMGALAEREIRVYDEQSSGFLPGEGCGIVLLKRFDDAVADGDRIYGVIRGWGVSSDGQGGLTTPSTDGQAFAIRRAYQRAGYSISTLGFIEGHGTGTTVGDKVELSALARMIEEDDNQSSGATEAPFIGIGSVKANIGHTKAAAGVAGLIKSVLSLHHGILPPMPGCVSPNSLFRSEARRIFPLRQAQLWSDERRMRAGVSAFGFGGINTHVTLESNRAERRSGWSPDERRLVTSPQDSEVFFFSAKRSDELRGLVEQVHAVSSRISQAELVDLAAMLASQPVLREVRAAIVASTPIDLHQKLERLLSVLQSSGTATHFSHNDVRAGVFLSRGARSPRIGFLYPGQGVQHLNMTRRWMERYDFIQDLYNVVDTTVGEIEGGNLTSALLIDHDTTTSAAVEHRNHQLALTQVSQPAIVAASMAVTKVLAHYGITPSLSIGYSLGEWTALWSAGVIHDRDLLSCVTVRGRAMASGGSLRGAMATVAAPAAEVKGIIQEVGGDVVIAGFNSPKQVVISGEAESIRAIIALCRATGFAALPLKVSNAFHSPLVSSAATVLEAELMHVRFGIPSHPVLSTVTGKEIEAGMVRDTLCRQILEPVRFEDAVRNAERYGVDAFVEVGPGRSLGTMISDIEIGGVQSVLSTDDEGGTSFRSINLTLGSLFAMGAPVQISRLFDARFTRPFDLDYRPRFIQNPCEIDPLGDEGIERATGSSLEGLILPLSEKNTGPLIDTEEHSLAEVHGRSGAHSPTDLASVVSVVSDLAAEITEYPRELIKPESLLLRDLNLNSIASAQLVAEAARRFGLPRPADTTEYATASIQQIAQSLFELIETQGIAPVEESKLPPPGLSAWTRSFIVEMTETDFPAGSPRRLHGGDTCLLITEGDEPSAAALANVLHDGGVRLLRGSLRETEFHISSILADDNHIDSVVISLSPQSGKMSFNQDGSPQTRDIMQGVSPLFSTIKEIASWVTRTNPLDFFIGIVQFGDGLFGRGNGDGSQTPPTPCSALLKSLFLELNLPSACIVELSSRLDPATVAKLSLEEFRHAVGVVEVGYSDEQIRRVPLMKKLSSLQGSISSLSIDDILLVTGGGRGIGADSALAIARASGCRVALVGRTKLTQGVETDAAHEVRQTLDRFRAAGIPCRYDSCDIADANELQAVLDEIEHSFGKITAVLHAAGNNIPQATRKLSLEAVEEVLAPKITGTINLIQILRDRDMKRFIGFGSIIGQTGMRGELAYAFANEWMNNFLLESQRRMPDVRFLSMNWSVWSGTGMGERLGTVDALVREGITPIEPDQGVQELIRLIDTHLPCPEVLVTGRLGNLSTRAFPEIRLPLLRFLEQPVVHYPEVELIAEFELSCENDPYLRDHLFGGLHLFPAVYGLEAMVQVASVLAGSKKCVAVEDLVFERPITVERDGKTLVRVIAQEVGDREDCIDVVIRSAETRFGVDHFRGRCIFGEKVFHPQGKLSVIESGRIPLFPERDLYGCILFQGPRFQRLRGYRKLTATACVAEIDTSPGQPSFGRYYSQQLLAGDPTVRDVFLHAIQPCVPNEVILPLSIDRITFFEALPSGDLILLNATERERGHGEYVYDVEICTEEGKRVERLEGFRCRAVGPAAVLREQTGGRIPAGLFAPYLERLLSSLAPQMDCSVAIDFPTVQGEMDGTEAGATDHNPIYRQRKAASEKAMTTAAQDLLRRIDGALHSTEDVQIRNNPDGKPELIARDRSPAKEDTFSVSASHIPGIALGVACRGLIGCDIESVVDRSDHEWIDLLERDGWSLARQIAAEYGEAQSIACTRVWTMRESMKKAGLSQSVFPSIGRHRANGILHTKLILDRGEATIVSQPVRLVGIGEEIPVVLTLLVSSDTKMSISRSTAQSKD